MGTPDDEYEDLDAHRSHKIFLKGQEIVDVVHKLVELISEEDEQQQDVGQQMMGDAFTLCSKYAYASGEHAPYEMKMEAATLIRKAARELVVATNGLEMFGFERTEYFQLVRDLVEEYRLLFLDWIGTFDPWDYIVIDRWGMFNPPGVGPNDPDPDDLL